jgi:hypothetical protein
VEVSYERRRVIIVVVSEYRVDGGALEEPPIRGKEPLVVMLISTPWINEVAQMQYESGALPFERLSNRILGGAAIPGVPKRESGESGIPVGGTSNSPGQAESSTDCPHPIRATVSAFVERQTNVVIGGRYFSDDRPPTGGGAVAQLREPRLVASPGDQHSARGEVLEVRPSHWLLSARR